MQVRAQQLQLQQPQRKRRAGGSRTLGGARLRALRQAAGRTQLWVEIEAEIGSGYLQRIESGKIAQPERATLERILTALQARYSEQREILEAFGYAAPTLPPSTEDLVWARASCRQELDAVPFPAYALDCLPRLLSWNRAVPRLFGLDPADPTLGGLAGRSLLEAWFEPASPLAPLVAEPDLFLPAMIRAFRHEMRPFHDEAWYAALLARLLALPRFRHYWQVVEREPVPAGPARALVPVRLHAPSGNGRELLQFHLASEPFTRDARFRLVYYFPADPATMRRCAEWASEIGANR